MDEVHLSKSRLISGWQCGKRLWLEKYAPEKLVYSSATELAFAVGHQVGQTAQGLFPGGILIGHDQDLGQALSQTREILAIPGPITLFEATFQAQGILIRADILIRDSSDNYRLIEVKASTGVKDYHLFDCAIQLRVLEQSGLRLQRLELAHINNQFVYAGDDDYSGLFTLVDVLHESRAAGAEVEELIEDMREVLVGGEPHIPMGAHCTAPFACPFQDYCRESRPEEPESGEYVLDPAAGEELRALGWPRYYFDFETIAPAVPRFAGTRPYSPQAFQWSCHVESQDGTMDHREFLAEGNEAPMRRCAESLIEALGQEGPVFMYSPYERTIIRGFITQFPDLAEPLERIVDRLYDLLPLTRKYYYHPDMRGSWSIKAVLPTVAPDLDYGELDIVSSGAMAEPAYLEMIDGKTTPDRKAALREALLRYCKLDTLAMVRLAHFLEKGQA